MSGHYFGTIYGTLGMQIGQVAGRKVKGIFNDHQARPPVDCQQGSYAN